MYTIKLLIIDDDKALCALLKEYLEQEGFSLNAYHDGNINLDDITNAQYDVIILDVMLPENINGFDILKRLRQANINTPVLMLTARGEEIDRIIGLELGADDYLAKPCNPRELLARIRAILRRVQQPIQANQAETIKIDDIECHCGAQLATYQKQELILTNAEYIVLEQLMQHAGEPVSKDTLTEKALGRKLTPFDRSIDIHISNLRKKLLTAGQQPCRIKTVRGQGYLYQVL